MTSYRYGYGRVSTPDQDSALQIDALHVAGVDSGGCSSTPLPVPSHSGPSSSQLFSVNANTGADEAARRYLANLAKIEAAADQPGPFMYGLRPKSLDRLL